MSDVDATIAGLDALVLRVHEELRQAVADTAHILQAQSMRNAPVGTAGNSTNAPGDLARSIDVEGPYGADGTYYARVGPTVTTANPGPGGTTFNYGRQREFGGAIYPNVSSRLVFTKFGQTYSVSSVYQRGSFYLTRARAETEPFIETVVAEHMAVAVTGG